MWSSYYPVIPMALINGVEGLATGWKTSMRSYNIRDILKIITLLIVKQDTKQMKPWYKEFQGPI